MVIYTKDIKDLSALNVMIFNVLMNRLLSLLVPATLGHTLFYVFLRKNVIWYYYEKTNGL